MEIPLFPLPLVLFPHAILPLHIFEERYRQMIHRCIENSEAFGVVLIPPGTSLESEDTIRRVGVTALIVHHERIEDGPLNIVTNGEKRFRILKFTGNAPYWTADVEFVDDDIEDGEELQESYRDVVRLYRDVHQLAAKLRGLDAGEIHLPESPSRFSYMVSSVLSLAPELSQDLLEMISTTGRLKALYVYLEEIARRLTAQLPAGGSSPRGKHDGHWVN